MPMLEMSAISSASSIRARPQGPRRIPNRMYATISAWRAYRATVARSAAPVKIRKIECSTPPPQAAPGRGGDAVPAGAAACRSRPVKYRISNTAGRPRAPA